MSISGKLKSVGPGAIKGEEVYVYEFEHGTPGRRGTVFTFDVAVTRRDGIGTFSAALRLGEAKERLADGKKAPLKSVEEAIGLLGEWCRRAGEALLETQATRTIPLSFSKREGEQ